MLSFGFGFHSTLLFVSSCHCIIGYKHNFLDFFRFVFISYDTMGVLFGRHDRARKKVVCKKVALFNQFGDSTRCGLTREGEIQLWEQLATNDEIVVGLIHTHPRHRLFLSSIDQHNIYNLQRDNDFSVSAVFSGMFITFIFKFVRSVVVFGSV